MVPIAIHYLGQVDEHLRPLILSMNFRRERKVLLDGEAGEIPDGDVETGTDVQVAPLDCEEGPAGLGSYSRAEVRHHWSLKTKNITTIDGIAQLRHESVVISWVLSILAVCTITIEPPICDHFNAFAPTCLM